MSGGLCRQGRGVAGGCPHERFEASTGVSGKRADVNAKDSFGYTALMGSSCFGNEHMVRLLLKYRADVSPKDNNGWTALKYAFGNRNHTIVGLLKACGAKFQIEADGHDNAQDGRSLRLGS